MASTTFRPGRDTRSNLKISSDDLRRRIRRKSRKKPLHWFPWTPLLVMLAWLPILALLSAAVVQKFRARRVSPEPVAVASGPIRQSSPPIAMLRAERLAGSSGPIASESPVPSAPVLHWNRPSPVKHKPYGPFTRRSHPPSMAELSAQLAKSPEILLESKPGPAASNLLAHAQSHRSTWAEPGPAPSLLERRTDLEGLPFRWGKDCHTHALLAKDLETLSKQLHTILAEAEQEPDERDGTRPGYRYMLRGYDYVNAMLNQDPVWRTPEAVPTLVQILQAEDVPYRRLLIWLLADIRGEPATEALARRAVFDVSAAVREQAVNALRSRPFEDYRQTLLTALRYPWPAAAEFAAEALVNLDQAAVVPELVSMLSEPAPDSPFLSESEDREFVAVRELVRVNHVQNCLLCHAASANKSDLVRALVPDPSRPVPRTARPVVYYSGDSGLFARADVVYLRQDFSLVQWDTSSSTRPPNQRFDFLVRTRSLGALNSKDQIVPLTDYPQRNSVLFALRELTGEDRGTSAAEWLKLLRAENQGQ